VSGRRHGELATGPRLLVVAGEASGDLLASRVVARLDAASFGLGGPLLAAAGTELAADLRSMTSMGLGAPAARAPALARALSSLFRAVTRERPAAALLVGLSEVNARLAALLRRRFGGGVRVLWYAPPQIWAWRAGRAAAIARACDELSLVLPFEVEHWARAGGRATYVGHPALEDERPAPDATATAPFIALLPGSRPHEVRAHLRVLVQAAGRICSRTGLGATLVQAPSLDAGTGKWMAGLAKTAGIRVRVAPLGSALRGARCALAASGTATLECAALGVPPVIVYRTDPVTYAVARRLVRVPFIGLPNLVLGRPAFPELVQDACTVDAVVSAALDVLGSAAFHERACQDARAALEAGLDARRPSERVAKSLAGWLRP
jgi:lipid-A-disaccharide synthase